MSILDRICKTCSASFKGGPRSWYCPNCRAERERERKRKYRQYGYARALGSTDKCVVCGSMYTVKGGQQKYCKDCAAEQIKEIDRRQGLEYYQKVKDAANPKRNAKRHVRGKICPICGTTYDANGKCRVTCGNPKCRKEYKNKWWREHYKTLDGKNVRIDK